MGAFKAVFYGARCLMQHSGPLNPAVIQHAYEDDGGRYSPDPAAAFLFRRAMLACVNLPTSMLLVAPLALPVPLKMASLCWTGIERSEMVYCWQRY